MAVAAGHTRWRGRTVRAQDRLDQAQRQHAQIEPLEKETENFFLRVSCQPPEYHKQTSESGIRRLLMKFLQAVYPK